jgi:hypothetical protein
MFLVVFFILYCVDYACLVWFVLSMVYDYLLYVVMLLLYIHSQIKEYHRICRHMGICRIALGIGETVILFWV